MKKSTSNPLLKSFQVRTKSNTDKNFIIQSQQNFRVQTAKNLDSNNNQVKTILTKDELRSQISKNRSLIFQIAQKNEKEDKFATSRYNPNLQSITPKSQLFQSNRFDSVVRLNSLQRPKTRVNSEIPTLSRNLSEHHLTQSELIQKQITYKVRYAARSKAGFIKKNTQKKNQDSFFAKLHFMKEKDMHLFIVMDGHGVNGHFVSQLVKIKTVFPVNLEKQFEQIQIQTDQAIKNAIFNTFKQCAQDLKGSGIDISFSGTTVVCGLVLKQKIYCANLGDSRCILVHGQNQHKILAFDHKPDIPSEKKRIQSNGGKVSPIRNNDRIPIGPMRVWGKYSSYPGLAMSRSMGDEYAKQLGVIDVPEITIYQFQFKNQYLVLASDGVWEYMSNEQIAYLVNRESCVEAGAKKIVEARNQWIDR